MRGDIVAAFKEIVTKAVIGKEARRIGGDPAGDREEYRRYRLPGGQRQGRVCLHYLEHRRFRREYLQDRHDPAFGADGADRRAGRCLGPLRF